MRNQTGGMIWQAYRVDNEREETILTKNAKANYFLVESEQDGYCDETTPNWRNSQEWKDCLLANPPTA